MVNSDKPLWLRFVLENNDEAEIVKDVLPPSFYEFQTIKTSEKYDFVTVHFRCRSFDTADYMKVKYALGRANVAFIIEQALD